jgi:hypothetical protein
LLANADLDTRGRHRLPPTTMSTFPALSSLPSREILGGVIRGHYAHLAQLTIGEVTLDAGTDVPMHDHPHEQVTYVISGMHIEFGHNSPFDFIGFRLLNRLPE